MHFIISTIQDTRNVSFDLFATSEAFLLYTEICACNFGGGKNKNTYSYQKGLFYW